MVGADRYAGEPRAGRLQHIRQLADGRVADPSCDDPDVRGVRRFNELVARDPRVVATEIQTVGAKGYDGFALVQVVAAPAA